MKILQVVASLALEWGGPVTVVQGLTEALWQKGVKSSVFATTGHRVGHHPIALSSAEVHLFPTSFLGRVWAAYAPGLAKALQRAMPEVDLVHIHELWHYSHYAAYRAAQKAQKPYLLTIHGELDSWALRQKTLQKRLFMRLIEQRILKNAVVLQALTQEEERQIYAQGRALPVAVIPNGIHPEEYENLPPRIEFERYYPDLQGKNMILFLSRLHPKKGLDLLAMAFGAIARDRDDIRLIIAGPDEGGYRAHVEMLLKSHGVLEKAIFTGMLTGREKLAALSRADIFTLPSYSEGFSVVLLEAMFCGCPVVITRQCQFSEVGTAEAGIVIDLDHRQLAAAFVRLLDYEESRRKMGENGRRLVLERFTWERVADQMIQLYTAVLEGKPAQALHQ